MNMIHVDEGIQILIRGINSRNLSEIMSSVDEFAYQIIKNGMRINSLKDIRELKDFMEYYTHKLRDLPPSFRMEVLEKLDNALNIVTRDIPSRHAYELRKITESARYVTSRGRYQPPIVDEEIKIDKDKEALEKSFSEIKKINLEKKTKFFSF